MPESPSVRASPIRAIGCCSCRIIDKVLPACVKKPRPKLRGKFMTKSHLVSLLVFWVLTACSGTQSSSGPAVGGSGVEQTGGISSLNVGGATAGGSKTTAGGSSSTAGSAAQTGGTQSSAAGGAPGGGSSASGGTLATGGASTTSIASTGGVAMTGGRSGSGGTVNTGGAVQPLRAARAPLEARPTPRAAAAERRAALERLGARAQQPVVHPQPAAARVSIRA